MKRIISILLAFILISLGSVAVADGEEGYTKQCTFAASNERDTSRLCDGNYRTYWKTIDDHSYVDIEAPDGAGGLVVAWSYQPDAWELLGSKDGVKWETIQHVTDQRFIQQHVTIDKDYPHYRIQLPEITDERYGISELTLYRGENPPDDVHVWQDTAKKAELMVISAHADDETVFFGGTLPYYSGEMQRDTVVIFMSTNNYVRRHEALNALWTSGVRTYPVYAPFPDEYSESIEECEKYWGRQSKVVRYLVEQLRCYKPDVIVTHDVRGEYGHGAHRMTAAAIQQAVLDAKDETKDAESLERYGAWDTPKLYLHLYKEDTIYMDCYDEPLTAFGGKSGIEVAEDALQCHASQLKWEVVRVHHEGRYNCRKYGLAYSSVGYDESQDFFDHVSTPTPQPTATPEPTPTPSPTPTISPDPMPVVTADVAPQDNLQGNLWQRLIAWLKGLFGV